MHFLCQGGLRRNGPWHGSVIKQGTLLLQVGGEAQTTVEKDSLVTVTVAGIIVGFLLAFGFIGGRRAQPAANSYVT